MTDPFNRIGAGKKSSKKSNKKNKSKKDVNTKKKKKQDSQKKESKNKKQNNQGVDGSKKDTKKKAKKAVKLTDFSNQNKKNSKSKRRVKKGSQLSIKYVAIGCFVFFLLIIGGFAGALFLAVRNPGVLEEAFGIGAGEIKDIFKVFAGMFFGGVAIGMFVVFLLNIYKSIVVEVKKFKYILGGSFSFLVSLISIGGLFFSFAQIEQIEADEGPVFSSNQTLNEILVLEDEELLLVGDYENFPRIAPMKMRYIINKELLFNRFNSLGIGLNNIENLSLDCGNGQEPISSPRDILTSTEPVLNGSCFFPEDKNYEVKLQYSYLPTGESETQQDSISIEQTIDAGVEIYLDDIYLEDALRQDKTQPKALEVPFRLTMDARGIFPEMNISQNEINWFRKINDEFRQIDDSHMIQMRIDEPGYQTIYYEIPAISKDHKYSFSFWASESSIVNCDITSSSIVGDRYRFRVGYDGTIDPNVQRFIVIDKTTGQEITSKETSDTEYIYEFDEEGIYSVVFEYQNSEGKKGVCTSQEINTSGDGYEANYELNFDLSSGDYQQVDKDKYEVYKIPSSGVLQIDSIESNIDRNFDINVRLNDTRLSSIGENKYEFEIQEKGDYELEIEAVDENDKSDSTFIEIKAEKPYLTMDLHLSTSSGKEPLDVTLDASASELNNEDDEIIYYTWDFGDGEVRKDTTSSRVQHTYRYDSGKGGVYEPTVTVQTIEGYTGEISDRISVERNLPSAKISIDSHPGQVARINQPVDFSVTTDGRVEQITWDFDNGDTLKGTGREFTEPTSSYDEPGDYTIRAVVEYADAPSSSDKIKLKVQE